MSDRTALVLGATGLVGRQLLTRLLYDARWSQVRVLARRSLGTSHPKLDERVADFERLEAHGSAFQVDEVFCCLGTTRRKAGSRTAFERVDRDYVLHAAELAAIGRTRHFLWLSSVGANPHSLAFYSRTKGRVEQEVATLPLERWTAVRPSLLLGNRTESRPGERVAAAIMRPLGPLLRGPLRDFRPIEAVEVARGMIALAVGATVPPGLQFITGSGTRRNG